MEGDGAGADQGGVRRFKRTNKGDETGAARGRAAQIMRGRLLRSYAVLRLSFMPAT